MFYQSELSFLCDVFKKSRVGVRVMELGELAAMLENPSDEALFDYSRAFFELIPNLEHKTVYRLTDPLGRCFRLILLPSYTPAAALFAGPFLSSRFSHQQILEIGEQQGISPQKQHLLSELYASLPVLNDDSVLFTVLDTFCEKIWGSGSFNVKDISENRQSSDAPISRSMRNVEHRDTLLSIKAMEHRYAFENDLIRAVSLGQMGFESKFHPVFSSDLFEKRVSDPVRNTKNYMIIMNTLLRKAAEQGGVHPIHIDQISSEFAKKIEELNVSVDRRALMVEMFRTYTRLVRTNSQKNMSPIVKNTILTIDADLSADLSPRTLAQNQSVSLGYLSTVFKKETGQTLSEHVRRKRMEYAAYLLSTTSLQIQTVALHCGILDVQYFSKTFKSHFKKTPTDYRRESGMSE